MMVTSDCRPLQGKVPIHVCNNCGHVQKKCSPTYNLNLSKIYQDYSAFSLTLGAEPKDFGQKVPITRTEQIFSNIAPAITNGEHWLDIGTGSGVMLRCASAKMPKWQFYGQDLTDAHCEKVEKINGVKEFYSGALSQIYRKFDVVSAIHVLEHVLKPHEILLELSELLTQKGVLLIQLPDINQNPFDLYVYDHISHFSSQTLMNLVKPYFEYVTIPKRQIFKEITLLASHSPIDISSEEALKMPSLALDFIKQYERFITHREDPVAVFGTGPAGVLSAANLSGNCRKFVDENFHDVGTDYHGRKVVKPSETELDNEEVVIPLPWEQQKQICKKYPNINLVNWFDRFEND